MIFIYVIIIKIVILMNIIKKEVHFTPNLLQ
ncbi:hypothetical protein SAMN05216269_11071 [Flavobacterium xinjiangense]|uniref:Uncharacterized protein n=1 Tax=Flavobacterium xinjiangense TaxID=178356 RepID=A0A1M7N8Y7_9FLAO|nr:hypothetical protein SAMN05216269_11071 [Flavobacterium xinjiangense]